jgi:hypothetical protein
MSVVVAIGLAGGAAFNLGHISGDFLWYGFKAGYGRHFGWRP